MELRLRQRLPTISLSLCLLVSWPVSGSVLSRNIDSRIRNSDVSNAVWAVHVEDSEGRVVYSRNGDTLVIPASVRKLFSAASVANCRGLDFQYRTELWAEGTVEDGVLHGNLIIRGSGDPSLGSRYHPRTTAVFEPWVAAVRAAGVRLINGGIVADASLFDDIHFPGSWKYDNIGESYAAPIDSLAFNENAVGVFMTAFGCSRYWIMADPWFVPIMTDTNCSDPRLTMNSVEGNMLLVRGNPGKSRYGERFTKLKSVTDPALYAAQAFEAVLDDEGIATVAEPRVTQFATKSRELLAVIESPPLYTLVGTMLESSVILFAEMLFKSTSETVPASWEGAQVVERSFLVNLVGIDDASFDFEDGSGLAVENYVTARATVSLLRWMTQPERRGVWEELLASPEETGTLQRRLRGFKGRLWAKTGTLDGVRGLAGYMIRKDGDLRYFAIFVNHYSAASWQAGEVIDQIVHEIDAW